MEKSREQHFLEDIAKQYGFTGTRKEVFLLRLNRQNEKLGNKDLIDRIENFKKLNNPEQSFQDYLKSICQAFSDCENCPVVLQKKEEDSPKVKNHGAKFLFGFGMKNIRNGNPNQKSTQTKIKLTHNNTP